MAISLYSDAVNVASL